jgi:hypothetical protein
MRLPRIKVGLFFCTRHAYSEVCKRLDIYMSQLIFVKVVSFGAYSFIDKVCGYKVIP